MPMVRITVSDNVDETRKKLLLEQISRLVADKLGKPENYMQTIFISGVAMTFGGSFDPAAFIEIKSIGSLSPENCKTLSSECSNLIQKQLSIPAKRIYIEFTDAKPSLWGWNGTTF